MKEYLFRVKYEAGDKPVEVYCVPPLPSLNICLISASSANIRKEYTTVRIGVNHHGVVIQVRSCIYSTGYSRQYLTCCHDFKSVINWPSAIFITDFFYLHVRNYVRVTLDICGVFALARAPTRNTLLKFMEFLHWRCYAALMASWVLLLYYVILYNENTNENDKHSHLRIK